MQSAQEHLKHPEIVFRRLDEFKMQLNSSKCTFRVEKVEFLGYLINGRSMRPTSKKVEAIQDFLRPKTVIELRRFFRDDQFLQ